MKEQAVFDKMRKAFYLKGPPSDERGVTISPSWPTTQDALCFGYQYGLKQKELVKAERG